MTQNTKKLLSCWNFSSTEDPVAFKKYRRYEFVLDVIVCGNGIIGEGNYLCIWDKDKLEKLNDDYMTSTFLSDVFFIGSDGGGTAFGVTSKGEYVTVPFMDMVDSEVRIIANTFDDFIEFLSRAY